MAQVDFDNSADNAKSLTRSNQIAELFLPHKAFDTA